MGLERFLLYIVLTSRLFSLSKQHPKDLFHCFFWPTLFLTTNLEPLFCFPKFKMSFLVWLFKSIFCVTGFQKLVRMCFIIFPFVFILLWLHWPCWICVYVLITSEKLSAIIFVRLFLHPSVLFRGVHFIYAGPVDLVLEVTEAVCVLFWICCVTMSHIHCFFLFVGADLLLTTSSGFFFLLHFRSCIFHQFHFFLLLPPFFCFKCLCLPLTVWAWLLICSFSIFAC